ncbi:hypothetical protein L596_012694 [Steinernema carpocapsae]|uniref:Saposin B-type domain-containing protein n=1 Tax=Steinernema carpocapsae TaxID=34508 RepID=A0A4U5NXV7_STECR|nr:hypothetical protein L596_012694 [Steinernema carpocapsae]
MKGPLFFCFLLVQAFAHQTDSTNSFWKKIALVSCADVVEKGDLWTKRCETIVSVFGDKCAKTVCGELRNKLETAIALTADPTKPRDGIVVCQNLHWYLEIFYHRVFGYGKSFVKKLFFKA